MFRIGWKDRGPKERVRYPLAATDYMHQNPVKRHLVERPGDWPWSSWRFYYLGEAWLLAIDQMP